MTTKITKKKDTLAIPTLDQVKNWKKEDIIKAATVVRDHCMKLKVKDVKDKTGLDLVHRTRMKMVKSRTALEAQRLLLNKPLREAITQNNQDARLLLDIMAKGEKHLQDEEARIKKEKDRIREEKAAAKAALIQSRAQAIMLLKPEFDGVKYSLGDEVFIHDKLHQRTDSAFEKALARMHKIRTALDKEAQRILQAEREALILEAGGHDEIPSQWVHGNALANMTPDEFKMILKAEKAAKAAADAPPPPPPAPDPPAEKPTRPTKPITGGGVSGSGGKGTQNKVCAATDTAISDTETLLDLFHDTWLATWDVAALVPPILESRVAKELYAEIMVSIKQINEDLQRLQDKHNHLMAACDTTANEAQPAD